MIKQIISYLIVGIIGIACGYYLMPKKEIIKTVEKQVDRVVTVVKSPDGTVKKVITDKSKINTGVHEKVNIGRPRYGLSVLVGTDFSNPVYGLHVNKELLGPITVGVFGLTNKTLGVSIGLNF